MRRARASRSAACALLALTLATAACVSDEFPANAIPFTPPAHYALWWEQAEACSGRTGNLSRVRFYTTPQLEPIQGAEGASGLYNPGGHRIVIDSRYLNEGGVVRHEMLHALFPTVRHPREIFLHRCGDVVPCSSDCLAEGGTPPVRGPAVRRIASSELKLIVAVRPSAPSVQVFEGRFLLVVIAQNPYNEPVVVTFPDSNVAGGPRTFGYRMAEDPMGSSATYSGWAYDRGAAYFKAGESKRAVYDHQIDPTGSSFPRPGAYYLVGTYSLARSDTVRFTLAP